MAKNLEKEFVNYQQALALKELGFNEFCFATWNGDTLDMSLQIPSDDYFTQAPLKQQVFRWFREKHDFFACIDLHMCGNWCIRIDVISENDYIYYSEEEEFIKYNTYEEAENAAIDKLIELVKQDKNGRSN